MEKVFNVFNMSTKPFLTEGDKSMLKSQLYRSMPNSISNYSYSNMTVMELEQTIKDLKQELQNMHYQMQTITRAILKASGEENI